VFLNNGHLVEGIEVAVFFWSHGSTSDKVRIGRKNRGPCPIAGLCEIRDTVLLVEQKEQNEKDREYFRKGPLDVPNGPLVEAFVGPNWRGGLLRCGAQGCERRR